MVQAHGRTVGFLRAMRVGTGVRNVSRSGPVRDP